MPGYLVTATHQGHRREFGPFSREQEARDWIIRHSEVLSNARVRQHQEDDNPEPPF